MSFLKFYVQSLLIYIYPILRLGIIPKQTFFKKFFTMIKLSPEIKKPTPRRTRGFPHAGKALNPRGTRATCNLVCQLRVDLLNYFLFFGLSESVKDN